MSLETIESLWDTLLYLLGNRSLFNDSLFEISQIVFFMVQNKKMDKFPKKSLTNIFKECFKGLEDRNKKYMLNCFRTITMLLYGCKEDQLKEILKNGSKNEEKIEENLRFINEKIRFFLTHKSPKFAWNASIVL